MTTSASQPQSAATWENLFPYPTQKITLAGGERMAYVDVGAGRPILFVHGNPTWSFYYHALISDLKSQYRCIGIDHIGCGRSDKPQKYDYCLDRHISNLVEFLDQSGIADVTLVAHDWGGAIGLGALLARESRFSRIVLLNTATFPPPYFPLRIRVCRTPVLGTIALRGLNLFSRGALTMATTRRGGLSGVVSEGLVAPYDSWENRVAVERFVRDIPTRASQPTWQTLQRIENSLSRLTIPKLLVWGMQDWCFREECLLRFEKIWPDAKSIRLSAAGHYVALDAPNEIVAAISEFAG